MSERDDYDLLGDIATAIKRIISYTKDMAYDQFLSDTKTQDAVIRNLEILGEAAKKISPSARNQYNQIPWKNMAGLRDRLIHHYFGVNLDVVWQIVTDELDAVSQLIEQIMIEEK